MEHYVRPTGGIDRDQRSCQGGFSVVAKPDLYRQGYATVRLSPGQNVLHGRFRGCMGSSYGRSDVVRGRMSQERQCHINVLELKAVTRAFDRWSVKTPRGTRWLIYTDNSTVVAHINKQGGTRSLLLCLFRGRGFNQISMDTKSIDKSQTPARQTERFDRCFISSGSFSGDRVESRSSDIPRDLSCVRDTEHRPVRYVQEHQTSGLLFTLPESGAYATDAMSLNWDGMFAFAYPPTGFLLDVLHKIARSRCVVLLIAPNRPTQPWFPLLLSFLVETPPGASSNQETAQATRAGYFSRVSRRTAPTRVATIQQSFEQAGLSTEVSQHLARKNRTSSSRTYEAKWRVFVRWCHGRRIDPLSAPLKDVLPFKYYCFDHLRLKPATIERYRAMLNPIYKARGVDLVLHGCLVRFNGVF